jgi:hypothetical protein
MNGVQTRNDGGGGGNNPVSHCGANFSGIIVGPITEPGLKFPESINDLPSAPGIPDLYIMPIVTFPKFAFTAKDSTGDSKYLPGASEAQVAELALIKLKINTGACLKGIRINEYLEDDVNGYYDSKYKDKLKLENLKLYAGVGTNEITENNVLSIGSLENIRAEYTYENITYVSNYSNMCYYDGAVYANLSEIVGELSSEMAPISYLLITNDINDDNGLVIPGNATNSTSRVIDAGWFEKVGNEWKHVRHELPVDLNCSGIKASSPKYLHVLSAVDRRSAKTVNILTDQTNYSLFLSTQSTTASDKNAYYMDLDYGNHGMVTINGSPTGNDKSSICWYGGGNAFINCVPVVINNNNNSNLTGLCLLGDGTNDDGFKAIAIACMNYDPTKPRSNKTTHDSASSIPVSSAIDAEYKYIDDGLSDKEEEDKKEDNKEEEDIKEDHKEKEDKKTKRIKKKENGGPVREDDVLSVLVMVADGLNCYNCHIMYDDGIIFTNKSVHFINFYGLGIGTFTNCSAVYRGSIDISCSVLYNVDSNLNFYGLGIGTFTNCSVDYGGTTIKLTGNTSPDGPYDGDCRFYGFGKDNESTFNNCTANYSCNINLTGSKSSSKSNCVFCGLSQDSLTTNCTAVYNGVVQLVSSDNTYDNDNSNCTFYGLGINIYNSSVNYNETISMTSSITTSYNTSFTLCTTCNFYGLGIDIWNSKTTYGDSSSTMNIRLVGDDSSENNIYSGNTGECFVQAGANCCNCTLVYTSTGGMSIIGTTNPNNVNTDCTSNFYGLSRTDSSTLQSYLVNCSVDYNINMNMVANSSGNNGKTYFYGSCLGNCTVNNCTVNYNKSVNIIEDGYYSVFGSSISTISNTSIGYNDLVTIYNIRGFYPLDVYTLSGNSITATTSEIRLLNPQPLVFRLYNLLGNTDKIETGNPNKANITIRSHHSGGSIIEYTINEGNMYSDVNVS